MNRMMGNQNGPKGGLGQLTPVTARPPSGPHDSQCVTIVISQTIQVEVLSNYPPKPSHGPGSVPRYGNKTCRFQTQRFPNIDYRTAITLSIRESVSTEKDSKPTKIYSFYGSNIEAANIICLTAHFWSSSHSMTKDEMDGDLLNDMPMPFYPGTLPWMSVDAIESFPFPSDTNFEHGTLTGTACINRKGSDNAVLSITRSMSYCPLPLTDGNNNRGESSSKKHKPDQHSQIGGALLNFDPKFKIALEYLHEADILGVGEFGVVYRGLYGGSPVAVKTTKASTDEGYFEALLNEMKVLTLIGEHPNVVKFYGASVARLREGIVHIVVELSQYGDLLSHIRSHFSTPCGPHDIDRETMLTMLSWCRQIASGMVHLQSKMVVHSDLACRNILVFPHNVVKLSDFGLSTKLYLYEQKKTRNKKMKIPWPWMAPESLTHLELTSESDVWAFGVTVWEIFSLGAIPYASYQFDDRFLKELTDGSLRLPKPSCASDDIYKIMLECWDKNLKRRPSFKKLETFFHLQSKDVQKQDSSRNPVAETSNGYVKMIRQKFDYIDLDWLQGPNTGKRT